VRVLIVEDEPGLRSYLVPLFEREGFATVAVATGAEALAAIRSRPPDLVLLDVGLPDISGLEVCRTIRRQPGYLPVVLLTGLDSRADELAGFDARADDYVTKPVDPETLLARVRAVLRLAARANGNSDPTHVIRLGDVELDLRVRELRRDGQTIAVKPRDFDLLAFLAEHPGQVFGKTQLIAQVWGLDFDGDPRTVEVRISSLRTAIERNPNRPRHLHSRRGVGYYLTLEPRE
jgi:DNA-binding response OmpR family regulator